MIRGRSVALAIVALVGLQAQAGAEIFLGSAQNFAVLGGSTVTNTGPSVINGDLGLYPGTSVTGFPPGILNGVLHQTDAVAQQAQNDLTTAYNTLWGLSVTQDLTGQDLGGLTLTSGVYDFSSSAQLTGTLTLDAQNDPNAIFVFRMGSTLTTASDSYVAVINAPYEGFCEKYFVAGSSVTLGTGTDFEGTIIAQESITLNTGADIRFGRALARTGAVTLDTNVITVGQCSVNDIPEPGTWLLMGCGLTIMLALRRRRVSA